MHLRLRAVRKNGNPHPRASNFFPCPDRFLAPTSGNPYLMYMCNSPRLFLMKVNIVTKKEYKKEKPESSKKMPKTYYKLGSAENKSQLKILKIEKPI